MQNSCWHLTQGEAADGQDVSARLVADAARVAAETDAGLPEIPEAVRQKVVTVSDAVKVVSEPAEVKRKALDLVKEGSVRTLVAGVKRVKEEMAGREHSGSTESHSPVNFDHSVSTYLSTIGDLVNQMPAESVDLLLAIQPSDARPQIFSILASCAEHALTPRGLLIVPVHAELLPEAIRRLTPRENDRKRDVQWGVEMDLLFRDPIGNSGEPHWVELRRVAVLILGKAEAKVSPGDDIIEVPPPGKEDNDHRQGLYDSHAMGMILRRFALPGHTVCALSFDGGRSVKMATVKLNDQSLATGEYLSYMTLISEELFGEALTSTTADDGRNKLLLY